MKIICDTTVWYNLAINQALYDRVSASNLVLCPTMMNVMEFVTNKRLINQEPNWLRAIEIANSYNDNSIKYNWLIHIATSFNLVPKNANIFQPNTQEWLKFIANWTPQEGLSESDNRIQEVRAGMRVGSSIVENVNDEYLKLRNYKMDIETTTDYFRNSYIKEILFWVNENFRTKEDLSWKIQENFHLGLEVVSRFEANRVRANEKSQKNKIEHNDFNDVFQFFFLQNDYKIWTFEKLIRDNAFNVLNKYFPEKIFQMDMYI